MFDWSDVRFFLELARQGRLGPAAKRLGVDQATVSRRIANLEGTLYCKLFDRTAAGFSVTEAGQKLLVRAEDMESSAFAMIEEIGDQSPEQSGRVRLATMDGLANPYLTTHLQEFSRRNPALIVELVTSAHLLNFAQLTKRQADVSLSYVPRQGPRLVPRNVGSFELRLYAAPDYLARVGTPRSIKDLARHTFVDYIDDFVSAKEVRWLGEVIQSPKIGFRSTSMLSQQNAAIAGAGIALLPSFSAARESRLMPVLTEHVSLKRNLWLTVNADLQFLASVKAVVRFLTDLIRQDQPFLNGLASESVGYGQTSADAIGLRVRALTKPPSFPSDNRVASRSRTKSGRSNSLAAPASRSRTPTK